MKAPNQSQTKSQSRRAIRNMTATARRGHGEGSVYRDAANGTWVGAISLGWRPDGSRIRRKATGRTKTEVREKLKKLQAEADAGLKTSASYTLAKAVDDWAAEALDGLAAKTVRSHVDLLRPVTMLIGQIPLRDLTAQDVRRTLNKLAQTRSTRTMARHVLAAGHRPRRRPPGPRTQPDRPDHPDLPRRQVARASRHLAIAADTELRRRHPGQTIEPLLSAEPAPASGTGRDGKLSEMATRIRDLAAQHQAFRERTGQRQRRMTPREDPGRAAFGDTLPSWWAPRPDGILRPPKPEITPSAKILQLAAEQDIELEAGGLPSHRHHMGSGPIRTRTISLGILQSGPSTWPDLPSGLAVSDRERPRKAC